MSSNRLAFAALGMACIASAAGGGYLATRQNTVPTPAAAMSPPPAASPVAAAVPAAPVATVVPERPVQETETVVSDSARKSTVAAKPTVAAKRVEPTTSAARTKGNAAPATARQDQRRRAPMNRPGPRRIRHAHPSRRKRRSRTS